MIPRRHTSCRLVVLVEERIRVVETCVRTTPWHSVVLSGCAVVALSMVVAVARGGEWIAVEIPDCADCTFEKVHFLTPSEGWVLARRGNDHSLARTHDGGETWSVEPLDADTARTLQRAEFVTPYEGWAPADLYSGPIRDPTKGSFVENGHNPGEDNSLDAPIRLYHSTDGGNSWTIVRGEVSENVYFGDINVAGSINRRYVSHVRFITPRFGVAAATASEAYLFAPGQFERIVTRYRGYTLLVTRDGGATWQQFVYGDPETELPATFESYYVPASIHCIDFVDEQYGWAPANGYPHLNLFRTHDGGRSWEALTFPQGRNALGPEVDFVTPTEGWSWGGTLLETFLHTTDGGGTWVSQPTHRLWAVLFTSRDKGWGAGFPTWDGESDWDTWPKGIYGTVDGGDTWNLEYGQPGPNVASIGFDQASKTVWAIGLRTLLAMSGSATGITPRSDVPTIWGWLKMKSTPQ